MNSSSSAIRRLCARRLGVGGDRHAALRRASCRRAAGGRRRRPRPGTGGSAQVSSGPPDSRAMGWTCRLPRATWKIVWPSRRGTEFAVDANRDLLGHSIAPIDCATACASVSRMSQRRQRPASACASSGAQRRHRFLERLGRARAQAGNARDGGRTGSASGGVWSYSNVGNDAARSALRPIRWRSMLRAASLPYAMAVATFDAPVTKSPPA